MKTIKLLLILIVSAFAFPVSSMDKPYATEAAQQEAVRQIIDPHSSLDAWYGTPESDFKYITSAYYKVASYLFPSTKATNELKDFFINYRELQKRPRPLTPNY